MQIYDAKWEPRIMNYAYKTVGSILDLDGRIACMSTIELKYADQPWCYTQHFTDVKDVFDPMEAADRVAQAFKAQNGLIILDLCSSYCENRFVTIMDGFNIPNDGDAVRNWLLKRAFRKAGFKYASECDKNELCAMLLQRGYDFRKNIIICGGYDAIKKNRKWLNEEIHQHLYHPRFIQKWIDNGNELEDYLK